MRGRVGAAAAVIAAGLATSADPAVGEEGVSRIEVMAKSCLACHGAQGQGPGHMPAINDLTAEGIANKLITYKNDGDADATVMNRHAAAYTADEIAAIAEYIANLSN
jgi:cytochrome c553